MSDIDWVIPHQTSALAIRKGMAEVSEALGEAPRQPAVVTVDQFGNTASTTHFVALARIPPGRFATEGRARPRCWPWRRVWKSER